MHSSVCENSEVLLKHWASCDSIVWEKDITYTDILLQHKEQNRSALFFEFLGFGFEDDCLEWMEIVGVNLS